MKKIVAILMALIMVISVTVVLAGGVATTKENQSEKVPVIIMFKDKTDKELIKQHGGEIKCVYQIKPAVAVSLPQKAIDALEKNPKIAFIVPDLEIFTMADETIEWGVDRIDADIVHEYNIRGTGVKVAIMDTGIDYDHPDLAANYKGGYDFAGRLVWQGRNDDDPMDKQGHGTHCAGIVAAVKGNGIGVIGVAPEAYLYAVKVFDDRGNGRYSDAIEGLEWCIDNNVQVISMSFGSAYSAGDPGIEPWINAAYDAGILLVGAAGNEGSGVDTVIYPARYANVIAVASTDSSDNRASSSSTGPDVELAAPGVGIYSTYWDDTYDTLSGTSMACPHVSGTAALVIASESLSNDDVRLRLQQTAEDLGATGKDSQYGYGLVDAEVAAGSAVTLKSIAVTPETATIPKGLTQQYTAMGTYSDASTADITSSVTWASSNIAVATIDSEGLATGVGEGITGITATLDSISDTATLTVTAPILQSITVMPDTATIEVDAKQQYTAMGTYSDASTADITSSVTWESSATAVATINSEGLATGVSEGYTEITATLGLISDTAALTVTLALKSIAVTPAIATIPKGLTQQYTATGTYSDASTADITSSVTWASSATAVATIDPAGLATGVSDGSTEIKATLDSISDTAALTVTAPSEPTAVIVESISYSTEGGKNQDRHLCIVVALVDNLENPVADASVSIKVYLDGFLYVSYTGTTGTDGTVTFKKNNAPSGTYTTTVTAVTAGELIWDENTLENSFIKY